MQSDRAGGLIFKVLPPIWARVARRGAKHSLLSLSARGSRLSHLAGGQMSLPPPIAFSIWFNAHTLSFGCSDEIAWNCQLRPPQTTG